MLHKHHQFANYHTHTQTRKLSLDSRPYCLTADYLVISYCY